MKTRTVYVIDSDDHDKLARAFSWGHIIEDEDAPPEARMFLNRTMSSRWNTQLAQAFGRRSSETRLGLLVERGLTALEISALRATLHDSRDAWVARSRGPFLPEMEATTLRKCDDACEDLTAALAAINPTIP